MRSLDGEKVWREIFNSLSDREKTRFHRLNMPVAGKEPQLDDVHGMRSLRLQAQEWITPQHRLTCALDSVYASMFYFELDQLPVEDNGLYVCSGHVFCRMRLPAQGRRSLARALQSTSSYFMVLGDPTLCVENIPKGDPPFKKYLRFTLETLDDEIGITLLGITSSPKTISGLPQTANSLIDMQNLDSEFGRADCMRKERPLPCLPNVI